MHLSQNSPPQYTHILRLFMMVSLLLFVHQHHAAVNSFCGISTFPHCQSPNKSFPELAEPNAMHCYVAFTYVSGSTVFFFCMRSTHRCKYVNVTIIFSHRINLPVKITLPYHPSAAGEMATPHASLAFHAHGMEGGRNKTKYISAQIFVRLSPRTRTSPCMQMPLEHFTSLYASNSHLIHLSERFLRHASSFVTTLDTTFTKIFRVNILLQR